MIWLSRLTLGLLSSIAFSQHTDQSQHASIQLEASIHVVDAPNRTGEGAFSSLLSLYVVNKGPTVVRLQGWLPGGAERKKNEQQRAYSWKLRFYSQGDPARTLASVTFPVCTDLEPGQRIQAAIAINFAGAPPRQLGVELIEPKEQPVYGTVDLAFYRRVGNDFGHPRKVMKQIGILLSGSPVLLLEEPVPQPPASSKPPGA